jgi:hypothetical protein
MTRPNDAKPAGIRGAALCLLVGCVVTGCTDPGPVGGTSTPATADAGKTPPVPGKKTAKVRPGSQIPGEANYEDKPGARGRGR